MAQKLPSGVRGVVVAWSITLVWEPCGMCWGQKRIMVQGKVGFCGHCCGVGERLVVGKANSSHG